MVWNMKEELIYNVLKIGFQEFNIIINAIFLLRLAIHGDARLVIEVNHSALNRTLCVAIHLLNDPTY